MDITTKESSNLLADKRALKFAAWQSKYEHLKTLLTHKTAIEHPLQMFRESLERGRERLLSFCFRRSHFSEQWPPLLQDDTPSLPFPPVDATTVAPATALAPTTGQDPVLPHQPPVLRRVVSAHCPCRHATTPTTSHVQQASCSEEEVHTPPKVAPKCVLDPPAEQPQKRQKQGEHVVDHDNHGSTSAGAPGLSDRRSKAFTSREQ